MRKQNHQIGAAQLAAHAALEFAKHLCLATVLFAEVDILPFHAFVSADNYHIHKSLSVSGWELEVSNQAVKTSFLFRES